MLQTLRAPPPSCAGGSERGVFSESSLAIPTPLPVPPPARGGNPVAPIFAPSHIYPHRNSVISQRSAARILCGAGFAVFHTFPFEQEGKRSAERRTNCCQQTSCAVCACSTASSGAPLAKGVRLSALHRGVLVSASGRAFVRTFRRIVSQLLAGGS